MDFKKLLSYLLESTEDEFDLGKYSDVIDKATQNIFAVIWADWVESNTHNSEFAKEHNLSGQDILEIAPRYEKFLTKSDKNHLEKMIYNFISQFEEKNGNRDIFELHEIALNIDGQSVEDHYEQSDVEHFVWLILMRMMGHGISWEDDHESPNFIYPHIEISYDYFSEKSFPTYPEDVEEEDEDDDDDLENEWERNADWWKQ